MLQQLALFPKTARMVILVVRTHAFPAHFEFTTSALHMWTTTHLLDQHTTLGAGLSVDKLIETLLQRIHGR